MINDIKEELLKREKAKQTIESEGDEIDPLSLGLHNVSDIITENMLEESTKKDQIRIN